MNTPIFHIHRWTKYGPPVSTHDTGHKQQWRTCTVCGKASFVTLPWDKQVTIVNVERALEHAASIKAEGSQPCA